MDYNQGQGGGAANYLTQLKGMMSPTSTAGMLGNQDLYQKYVEKMMSMNQQPASRADFLSLMQSNPQVITDFLNR